MEIKIKVISRETIKPSSPTPKSKQKHQLSFLDQLFHSSFIPFAYFYPSNPKIPNSEKAKQLKKSLSEVLSTYYPLAGRVVGNLYVDCNDTGVPFSDAEADCDLSQVVINPNPTHLNNFLPDKTDHDRHLCMAVQATYFRCGGVAVGILISHKIADGVSFISFTNTWSAAARNGHCRGVPLPKFDAAAYFPPLDFPGFQPAETGLTEEAQVATKILTFSASKIAALQEKYSAAAGGGHRPNRVEALSAFIWTHFASGAGMKSDPDKIFTVHHAVNLRTRADPPLSQYHFGNIIDSSKVMPAAGDGDVEFLQKIRAAVKAIDGGYVARMKNSDKLLKEKMGQANKAGEVVRFIFSSLCGFPLYEADFGWGRPIRVWHGGFPYKNTVVFSDTESRGGIEALIHLTKSDMEIFETNFEL